MDLSQGEIGDLVAAARWVKKNAGKWFRFGEEIPCRLDPREVAPPEAVLRTDRPYIVVSKITQQGFVRLIPDPSVPVESGTIYWLAWLHMNELFALVQEGTASAVQGGATGSVITRKEIERTVTAKKLEGKKLYKESTPEPQGVCRQASAAGDAPGFLSDGDDKIQPDIILVDAGKNETRITAEDVLHLIGFAESVHRISVAALRPFWIDGARPDDQDQEAGG